MKSFKSLSIAILSCLLLILTSCEVDQDVPNESANEQQNIPKDIIQKLEKAGFHTNEGLFKVENGYVVERDIFLTKEEINELSTENKEYIDDQKHYRSSNLVSGTRTIRVYADPALGAFVRNSLDEALRRYNALNLRLTFQRTDNASSNDIRIIPASNAALFGFIALAGFPENGRPHNTIQMNTSFYGGANRLANTATVIAHEIGHCIGFRHTDYANRGFSCGGGFNPEPVAPNGAIHISGTPTTYAVSNSWMLACTNRDTNRPFIASDRTALLELYGRGTPPQPPTPTLVNFYRFLRPGPKTDHFYSTNRIPPPGYIYQTVACKIYKDQATGTVPLFWLYNSTAINNFYTINVQEATNAANNGYTRKGIAGYVFPNGGNGRVPLQRYYNGSVVDHFYSINPDDGLVVVGIYGYTHEGPAGYVPR